jgi:hypothetical protein
MPERIIQGVMESSDLGLEISDFGLKKQIRISRTILEFGIPKSAIDMLCYSEGHPSWETL